MKRNCSGKDDVRSLLYDSQDSDEIESLVFGNAANENDDEELTRDTSGSRASKEADNQADKSRPLTKAFGCDLALF